jgi:hypothetical protein
VANTTQLPGGSSKAATTVKSSRPVPMTSDPEEPWSETNARMPSPLAGNTGNIPRGSHLPKPRSNAAVPNATLPATPGSSSASNSTRTAPFEKSVRDLTWSYASFLAAGRAKTGQSVLGEPPPAEPSSPPPPKPSAACPGRAPPRAVPASRPAPHPPRPSSPQPSTAPAGSVTTRWTLAPESSRDGPGSGGRRSRRHRLGSAAELRLSSRTVSLRCRDRSRHTKLPEIG